MNWRKKQQMGVGFYNISEWIVVKGGQKDGIWSVMEAETGPYKPKTESSRK